ncbi:MAG: thiamine ABC transporter ATP-binding protein, partial [Rhodobacteraceae bacterium]|nr:thiamine ABC transporter ATP-binding protein [Paracoccaceae bacterium]
MLTLERAVLRQEGFTLTADFTVPAGAQVAVMGPS